MENRLGNGEKLENRTIKRSLGTAMEKKNLMENPQGEEKENSTKISSKTETLNLAES
jgi:hypothetical protein